MSVAPPGVDLVAFLTKPKRAGAGVRDSSKTRPNDQRLGATEGPRLVSPRVPGRAGPAPSFRNV